MQITYLNLREHVSSFLKSKNIPYIKDIRKEINACNQFMEMDENPKVVMELISKLIEIKKHFKYSQDKFWVGCAINVHCALSYRVQIETVYLSIAPHDNDMDVAIMDKSGNDNNIATKTKTWADFLKWARMHTTESRFKEFENLQVEQNDESKLTIYNLAEGMGRRMIEQYFKGVEIEWVG